MIWDDDDDHEMICGHQIFGAQQAYREKQEAHKSKTINADDVKLAKR